MGKNSKSLGLNKAATTGVGKGKRLAGANHKSRGVNKPATAGAGLGGAKGAGGEGGWGWGTLSPTGRSTSKKVVNEEENRGSSKAADASTLPPAGQSTSTKTAVNEEENCDLYRDAEEGEKIQKYTGDDEAKLLFAHYGYVPGCCFDDGYNYDGPEGTTFWW